MARDSFERIATSSPINRTAAIVTGAKGEQYVPIINTGRKHYEAPPRTVTPPAGLESLIGSNIGRLVVVGWIGKRWLVRCQCGRYEERRSKSVRTPNIRDRCGECERLIYMRRHEHWLRTGKQMPDSVAWA